MQAKHDHLAHIPYTADKTNKNELGQGSLHLLLDSLDSLNVFNLTFHFPSFNSMRKTETCVVSLKAP